MHLGLKVTFWCWHPAHGPGCFTEVTTHLGKWSQLSGALSKQWGKDSLPGWLAGFYVVWHTERAQHLSAPQTAGQQSLQQSSAGLHQRPRPPLVSQGFRKQEKVFFPGVGGKGLGPEATSFGKLG